MKASTLPRTRGPRSVLIAILCAGALLGLAPAAFAEGGPSTSAAPDAAHRALAEGRYGEAATAYEALVRERGYSAPLLYDLGNAYLRDGKPAPALLAYERARLLAPRDEAIATNLAAARAALGIPVERSAVERWAGSLSLDAWAWLAASAFWLTVGAAGAGGLWKRRRSFWHLGAAVTAVGGLLAAGGFAVASRELGRGLAMAAAPVLVSPFESAQSSFSLAPGEEVDVGRARDGYVFVRDARGRSGWAERVQVTPLIPTS